MNQVTLIGRLVREIQLQEVGEGKSVVNNTIAVQRIFKTEQQQQADFIPLVAWGKVAKLLDLYCEKGDLIGINGKMQSRSYINSENITIFVVEMRVEEIQFLQNKRTEETIAIVEPKKTLPYLLTNCNRDRFFLFLRLFINKITL